MTEDILTVMWKESKGLLRHSSSRWKSIVILLVPIVLFGVIFPIQFREEWLVSGWSLIVAVITPLLLIASTIAESFAGERERHTLETLLASRLPDRSILLGKLLMSVLFGWGMTLILLLLSMIMVNMLEWQGAFKIYSPMIFGADFAASLLMSGMVANLGILISLRAPTVQGAAQTIMLLLFMPFLILQAVVFLLPTFLPKEVIQAFLLRFDLAAMLFGSLLALLVVNIGLFLACLARFQRARLIL